MPRLKKPIRVVLQVLLVTYALLLAFLMVVDRLIQYRSSDEELRAYFVKKGLPIQIAYYKSEGRQMRYLYTGNDPSKPILFFVHGAPSSSSYYRHFFSDTLLRRVANLFAVDRPGYGYSGFGRPEPDMGRQAAMIAPILDSLHRGSRPVVLVGASYGTPIASRIAMDYPHLADAMLLIAPSLAPGEEKTYWVSYVLESPFFTWAQPRMLHSANVEKFTHRDQLEQMRHRWQELKLPIIYYQGEEDDLIYTTNADFARQHITESECLDIRMIPRRGHLLVYKEAARLRKAMLEMLDLGERFYTARQAEQSEWMASRELESE